MRTKHLTALRLVILGIALMLFFTAFPAPCHAACTDPPVCDADHQVCYLDNSGHITCGNSGLLFDPTTQTMTCENLTAASISVTNYLTLSDTETAVGYNARAAGIANTALGINALHSIAYNGANNVALGVNALYANTEGGNNVALGVDALYANTTGGSNVALGFTALYTNTTGNNNVALGYKALHATDSGDWGQPWGWNNVAIGSKALSENETGTENVAIGYGAMEKTTRPYDTDPEDPRQWTGSDNVAVGMKALNLNIIGMSNVAIGAYALEQNNKDGEADLGNNNTAVGFAALGANTQGFENTAVGNEALISNTEGIGLVAVGSATMMYTIKGSKNTALGNAAMLALTDSIDENGDCVSCSENNTAVGFSALASKLINHGTEQDPDWRPEYVSSNNTAVGSEAMYNIESGSHNTATGYLSLYGNTEGSYNAAFGAWSLTSNIDGSNNSALGAESQIFNTSGSVNASVGDFSMYSNTTGSGNSAFGSHSLYANTTGIRNVAIGYYAGYWEMGSDSFYLSNKQQSSNANERLYSLLYGKFAESAGNTAGQQLTVNGKLGVGTLDPGKTLQVGDIYVHGSEGMIRLASKTSDPEGSPYRRWDIGVPETGNVTNGIGYSFIIDDPDTYPGQTNIPEFIVKYASGNVGIGTISPYSKLTVDGNADFTGNVGIGTTNPSGQLQLSGDYAYKLSTSTWYTTSDRRLKKDILPFRDGLDVIEKINPVTYRFNGFAGTPADYPGIGVLAQEMKEVAPYTVGTFRAKLQKQDEAETELYNFNAHALTFVLINAIKELDERTKGLPDREDPRPDRTKDTEQAPLGEAVPQALQALFTAKYAVEASDILVLNPANGDELYRCALKADPLVVGIAAEGAQAQERVHVIQYGTTWVKADATAYPIAKGDLLVASLTLGHAMKAAKPIEPGTVIGKALEPLDSGTGLIKVIVMLR